MFGKTPKQPSQQGSGKIRKKLSDFPELEDLNQLLEECEANRGSEIEVTWTSSFKTFCINIKLDKTALRPIWNIWHDDGQQTEHAGRFETDDINTIMDVIWMLKPDSAKAQSQLQTTSLVDSQQAQQQAQPQPYNPIDDGYKVMPADPPEPEPAPKQAPKEEEPQSSWKQFSTEQLDDRTRAVYSKYRREEASEGYFSALQSDPTAFTTQAVESERTAYPGTPVIEGGTPRSQPGAPAARQEAGGMPEGSLPADFFSNEMSGMQVQSTTTLEGKLKHNPPEELLLDIRKKRLVGM
ncbi:MAG: hypothetical protein K2Z81_25750, partial [Cyanobacteria bacterium]|nr:hypothetical protein [Cyanobacteriota bacterium]